MATGTSTATIARRAVTLAIAAAAATGLTACGAGQVTQTDSKQTAIAGINVDEGDLALRNLQIESDQTEGYAAGEAAPLRLWISNESEQPVSLTGVTTEAGEAVTLVSEDAAEEPAEEPEDTAAPDGEEGTEPADEPTDGAEEDTDEPTDGAEEPTDEPADGADEPTDDATDEAADEPAEEPALIGQAEFEIEVPAGDFVRLDRDTEGNDHLLLEGLTEPLVTGDAVTLVFEFSDGSEVTANLPVVKQLDWSEPSYFDHPGLDH